MSPSPASLPVEVAVLEGLQVRNYSFTAACAFTVWDICLTMEDEVREIWKRPWTRLKSMYLGMRYFSLIAQLLSAGASIKVAHDPSVTFSQPKCKTWTAFQGVAVEVLTVSSQYILMIRVSALYRSNRFLRTLMFFLYLVEILVMTLVIVFTVPRIQYGFHCVALVFPMSAIGLGLAPLTFDTFIFVLTMNKFLRSLRDGWGRSHVIMRFMTDGIWAFALMFVAAIANTYFMIFAKSSVSAIAFSWLLAIPPFAGYRIVLNMNHLLTPPRNHPSSDPEDVEFDTFLSGLPVTSVDYSTGHDHPSSLRVRR